MQLSSRALLAAALAASASLSPALALVGEPGAVLRTSVHIPRLQAYHAAQQAENEAAASIAAQAHAQTALLRGSNRQHPLQLSESVPQRELSLSEQYPAYNFSAPLDHFDSANNATLPIRYWVSTRHYKPPSARPAGTPSVVYLLDSGETNAEGRLPFLDHGILDILANATGGVAVVIEHRYYGRSVPVRGDIPGAPGDAWGEDAMRFLNNSQALADSALFARTARFDGIDEDLRAGAAPAGSGTPWISYGGSYPGARSAHLRVLYPELFTGAIASSAVIAAVEDYPEYFYPIARGADTDCSQAIQAAVQGFDAVAVPLAQAAASTRGEDTDKRAAFLEVMGAPGLGHLSDLANVWSAPLGQFQALNWDPAVSSQAGWHAFCKDLTHTESGNDNGNGKGKDKDGSPSAAELKRAGAARGISLPDETWRYATHMRARYMDGCTAQAPDNATAGEYCFGTHDYSAARETTKLSTMHSWQWQTCQTWGYFQTAPPKPRPGHPSGPKLISELITHDYSTRMCREAYAPGTHYQLPAHPNVSEVNSLGGFALSAPNLAIIDGQYDPWRPATGHSEEYAAGGNRPDTLERPFKLIPDCWHHCDENSLPAAQRDREPPRIKKIHAEMVEFVKHWLDMD